MAVRKYACQYCKAEIVIYGPGRPRRWCTEHDHRYKRVNADFRRIAEEFKSFPCCRESANGVCPQHRQQYETRVMFARASKTKVDRNKNWR